MRKLLASTLVGGAITLAVIGMPAAHADLHGCTSISNVFNLTSGDNGPVNQGGPCNFTYVAGDTYSGAGPFTVDCPVGGVVTRIINHGATDAPTGLTPFTCDSGSNVVVNVATGGVLAIGSLT
jgi:hypothetical protein